MNALSEQPEISSEWSDDELRETLHAYFGVGSDAGLPDEIRFLVNVATLVEKQLESGVLADTTPALFLLCPSAPPALFEEGVVVHMLDNGLTALGSSIWFVGPVFGTARQFEVADWDDVEVFSLVEEAGAGTLEAIYVETRTPKPELRFYPSGVNETNDFVVTAVPREAVDLTDVYRAVDGVHTGCLITPNVLPRVPGLKLWQNAAKYRVARQAEATIEHHLHIGLHAAFPTCRVDTQLNQATGRLDIDIAKADWKQPGKVVNHVVLELKVLRTYGSEGNAYSGAKVARIIREGVTQASAYRDEQNARLAALCCFDMRKSVSTRTFTSARALAKDLEVDIHSWQLFATSELLRAERTKARRRRS